VNNLRPFEEGDTKALACHCLHVSGGVFLPPLAISGRNGWQWSQWVCSAINCYLVFNVAKDISTRDENLLLCMSEFGDFPLSFVY
jgi:hypothetical protein